jgi:hypothetical protein
MVLQEMLKRPEQLGSVPHPTLIESFVDVIDDHCPNGFPAVRLLQQIVRQSGSRDFGDMFMLADSRNFFLVEAAKTDAIL